MAQLAYTSFTSRVLPPAVFATFTAATVATGVAALLLGSSLPSAIVANSPLTCAEASTVRIVAWVGGGVASLATYFGAPYWASLWNEPSAATLVRVISIQPLLGLVASVELALLRSEKRPITEAAAYGIGSIAGFALGAIAVHRYVSPESLLLNPIGTAGFTLVAATALRRKRYRFRRPVRLPRLFAFIKHITGQSIGFFAITSGHLWAVSRIGSTETLGQYSRAALVATLPSTALAMALTRALQPHYRSLSTHPQVQSALSDVATMATFTAGVASACLAAASPALISMWLGPQWAEAGSLAPLLVLSFGLYTVFVVVGNAVETVGKFGILYRCLIAMLLASSAALGLAVHLADVRLAASSILVAAMTGLGVLIAGMRSSALLPRSIYSTLAKHGGLAAALFLALRWTETITTTLGGVDVPRGLTLAAQMSVAILLVLATIARTPAWTVVQRRGLTPEILRTRHRPEPSSG